MTNPRLLMLDWLRGIAILLMVVYHFCYDLYFFNYLDTAFGKGYWIPFRYVIVVLFLGLVGVSLVISHHRGINWSSVKKRSLQLALAASFVTASSYFIAPDKLTIFGILHFILLASLLSLWFIPRPKLAFMAGIVIFTLGHLVQLSVFDATAFHWLGMVETKRPALDYVPLFPWLGVVLIGIYFGHVILKSSAVSGFLASEPTSQIRVINYLNSGITRSGQHSLVIYLVHQPIMFSGFWLFHWLVNS